MNRKILFFCLILLLAFYGKCGAATVEVAVYKSLGSLEVWQDGELFRQYPVASGWRSGAKQKFGDKKTPEGEFYIVTKGSSPRYKLSLGLSYPDVKAAKRGLEEKLISQKDYESIIAAAKLKKKPPWHSKLGGEIMIHGGGLEKILFFTFGTEGCIRMENTDMQELYRIVPLGTKVTIYP